MISTKGSAFIRLMEGAALDGPGSSMGGTAVLSKTGLRPTLVAWASCGFYAAMISLLTAASICAHAAGDDDFKPVPPYVSPVPESLDWVMRIQVAGHGVGNATSEPTPNPAQLPPSIKEIHYTKVKDLLRVQIVMSNGETREYYDRQGFNLMPTTVPGKVTVLPASPASPPYPYYYPKGFYCMHWIKPEYYVGNSKYKAVDCFYYKGEISNVQTGDLIEIMRKMGNPAEKNPIADSCEAWIDIKTQFPLALKINEEIFEFIYNKPPGELTLSPAYQKAWEEHQAMQARLEKLKYVR